MRFLKHIIKRYKTDGFRIFCVRIPFFFLRKYLEIKLEIKLVMRIKFKKLKSKNRFVIKNILGSKMYLDLNDKGISRELFVNNIRKPFLTELIKKTIKKGDIIADIGANIGYYALLEAKLVGDKGKVYAIEPVRENFNLLKRNISLNNYSNIETFRVAIGSKNKTSRILLSKKSNWCSMIKTNNIKIIGTNPVNVVTLDAFLKNKPYPDIIRMDVEGYETEIIKGMKNILSTKKPLKLFIELHSIFIKDKGIELLKFLKANGFQIEIFFHERFPILMKEGKFIRGIFNLMGRITSGPYEFKLLKVNIDDLIKKERLLSENVFEVFLKRD